MLERDIERRVCEYAKKKKMLVFKFTSPGHRGVCDRMFVCKGRVFFIEFKAYGKKPTKLQERHHQTLVKEGVSVYVVDSVEIGKEVIDDESKGSESYRNAVRDADCNSSRPEE